MIVRRVKSPGNLIDNIRKTCIVCQAIDRAPSAPALQHPDALASTGQHWTEFPAAPRGPDFSLFGNLRII